MRILSIIQLDIFKHRQVRCKKKHIHPPSGGNFIRLHLLCRLRRDKPATSWATHRSEAEVSLSSTAACGEQRKATTTSAGGARFKAVEPP